MTRVRLKPDPHIRRRALMTRVWLKPDRTFDVER